MSRIHQYFVYILLCADNSYYVGVTNNVFRRLEEQQNAINPKSYTARRLPIKLVYYRTFGYIYDAIFFEKKIKRWSHNKKKALIEGDWKKVQEMATCKNSTSHRNFNKEWKCLSASRLRSMRHTLHCSARCDRLYLIPLYGIEPLQLI